MLKNEFNKIIRSRIGLILLLATILAYPGITLTVGVLQNYEQIFSPIELFVKVNTASIVYAQTYFFIPAWVILLVGREFDNQYVNRYVFENSRASYFKSKLGFAFLLTAFFTVLGIAIAMIYLTINRDSLQEVNLFEFLPVFISQQLLSHYCLACLLISLQFIFKSQGAGFAVFFAWSIVEGLLFTLFDKVYSTKLLFLPIHAVRLVYLRNGEGSVENYYNPIQTNPLQLTIPISVAAFAVYLAYNNFSKKDLTPLSD